MKYIVCINRAGIGNRLRGLISAVRLCKLLDRKLLLYWENNPSLGCDFKELFDNKFDEIDKDELKKIRTKKNSIVYRDVLEEEYNDYDYIVLDTWKFVFLPEEISKGFSEVFPSKEGKNIDFEFERIPLFLREEILNELRNLKPTGEVMGMVEGFLEKHNLGEHIGLHIRRGDNRFTTDGKEKVSSDDKFINIIKENPTEKFFISTDSVDVAKKIKGLFGERIIYYPKEDKKRSTKESIREALVAMILLSKTKEIYGSFLSTFSEMAWWFSGCETKITIVGAEDFAGGSAPKTFFQKVWMKIKFYKVNFLRWIFGVYK